MKTRAALVGALVLALTVSAAPGQPAGEQRARASELRARVQRALNLSPEQQTELNSLRERLREELMFVRAQVQDGEIGGSEAREIFREAMRAHREARELVLSPQQRALLDRARQYARERKLALPTERQSEPRRPRLVEQLELTRDQQDQWRALRRRQREALLALQEAGIGPGRDEIRQMREDHRQAFERLLTLEQRAVLAGLRYEWRNWQDRADEYAHPDPTAVEDDAWGRVRAQPDWEAP